MKKNVLFFVLVLTGIVITSFALKNATPHKSQDNPTPIIVDQSNMLAFLASLDENQKDKIHRDFKDDSRENWHYLPHSSYKRNGLTLKDLSESQTALFQNVLMNYLSQAGYDKTQNIISLENVLAEIEGDPVYRDPEQYYISVYGHPEQDSLWSWSFEGHHISLNFTILNDQLAAAPRFFGANPGEVPMGPRKGERVLHAEEDLAFDLVGSMSGAQQEQAIVSKQTYNDVLSRNQSHFDPLDEEGISVESLNEEQQMIIGELLDVYLSSIPEKFAEKRRIKIEAEEFHDLLFAWAGATHKGDPHYYRIQGKSFLIEFDNTQNNANHVHTVWRDFTNDFGRDLIREHYQHAEHHNKH